MQAANEKLDKYKKEFKTIKTEEDLKKCQNVNVRKLKQMEKDAKEK